MTEAHRTRSERHADAARTPGVSSDVTEHCEINAGRLVIVYEAAVHAVRREVIVTADQGAPVVFKGQPAEIGGELIHNGDPSDGVRGWRLAEGSKATLRTADAADSLSGAKPAIIIQEEGLEVGGARLDYVGADGSGAIPIGGGRGYQLSAHAMARGCSAVIVVEFSDAEDRALGSVVHHVAGEDASEDDAVGHIVQGMTAPGTAARARLSIRKSATRIGASESSVSIAWISLSWAGHETVVNQLSDELRARIKGWRSPMSLALSLPSQMLDGRPHKLRVDDPITGRPISGSPVQYDATEAFEGSIEDGNGTELQGWARSTRDATRPVEVAMEIDGTEIGRALARSDHAEGPHGFAIGIPSGYLDGSAHHVVARAMPTGVPIEESVRLLPRVLTPWDSLVRFASDPLPVALSPLAAHRYRSLQLDAAAASQPQRDGADIRSRQIGRAHEVLVRGFEHNRDFSPLEFPVHDEPTVSIVIPVHDKFSVTYHGLAALLFAHVRTSFEVIVVDDASHDETATLEEFVRGITIIRNEANLGFVGSCNHGASKARGRYITFLNNDTEPTAAWLDEVMSVFDNFDAVGLVGSKLIYPDGRLQEAGGVVWADGNPLNYGRDANAHRPEFNYTRQADYLSGAAITLPRATWDAVDGFSSEFAPAYFEDTDLAFKVRAHGEKTIYAPFSVVVHHEGISSGTSVAAGMKRFQEVNRPRFKQKWAEAFGAQSIPGGEVDLAKDRGIQGRVLVIDNAIPQPDRNASSYAAIQEMRLIQSLGFKVTFFPENLAWMGADTEYLQRMGVEVVYAPFVSSLEDLLAQRGSEFDVVYVTRFAVAARCVDTIRRLAPRAKLILTLADLHFLRQIRDAISGQGSMTEAVETREKELATIREADVTLSYSDIEHAVILSHNLETGNVALAPWVVDPEPTRLSPQERRDIAFLGSYAHPPNAQAVRFFVAEVMPLLRERMPGVAFRIYGSGWPEHFTSRLASDDVIFEGFVDQVSDALGACRVAVAPLVSGAGLKGKVIDALSCGTPQVLSPLAAEGTGLRDGIEALIAESPADWTDSIVTLFEDDDTWAQMSRAAVRRVTEAYSFERGQGLMREAFEAVGVKTNGPSELLYIERARPRWFREREDEASA